MRRPLQSLGCAVLTSESDEKDTKINTTYNCDIKSSLKRPEHFVHSFFTQKRPQVERRKMKWVSTEREKWYRITKL